jgi:hypothetical protein
LRREPSAEILNAQREGSLGLPLILDGAWRVGLPAAGRSVCAPGFFLPGPAGTRPAIWRQSSWPGAFFFTTRPQNEIDWVLQGSLEEHPLQKNCAELILWTSQTGD